MEKLILPEIDDLNVVQMIYNKRKFEHILENSILFRYTYVSHNKQFIRFCNKYFEEFIKTNKVQKSEKYREYIKSFVCNLIYSQITGQIIAISSNKNDYDKKRIAFLDKWNTVRKFWLGYRPVMQIKNWFKDNNLIEIYEHKLPILDQNSRVLQTGMRCTMFPTNKFVQALNEFISTEEAFKSIELDIRRVEMITLKDETEQFIKLPNNNTISQSIQFLNTYNKYIKLFNIIYNPIFITNSSYNSYHNNIITTLHRNIIPLGVKKDDLSIDSIGSNEVLAPPYFWKFNPFILTRKFNRGSTGICGRFYPISKGPNYLTITKTERNSILIQFEDKWSNIIERDFSSMHPSILRSLKGITRSDELKYSATYNNQVIPKVFQKKMNLIGFNCKNYKSLVKTLNHDLMIVNPTDYEGIGVEWFIVKQSPKTGTWYRVWNEKVIKAIVDHNSDIEEFYYNDFGVYLQKFDSEVALKVMTHFMNKNECCLCIHDSFIVREALKEELDLIMKISYDVTVIEFKNKNIKEME